MCLLEVIDDKLYQKVYMGKFIWHYDREQLDGALAKINISYSILFILTTSYSSYFGGKKGISRNKTSFFLLMCRGH